MSRETNYLVTEIDQIRILIDHIASKPNLSHVKLEIPSLSHTKDGIHTIKLEVRSKEEGDIAVEYFGEDQSEVVLPFASNGEGDQ